VLLSPIEPDLATIRAQVEFVHTDPREQRPLASALRVLASEYGVGKLLCEGGPTLMRALLTEQLVDELFLTLAPALAGGASGPTIVGAPPLPEPLALRLLWLLRHDDALYLRYAIRWEKSSISPG
jgi:riboflavin biosynthesis pyrimidine reductase